MQVLAERFGLTLTGNTHAADVRHTLSNQNNTDYTAKWITRTSDVPGSLTMYSVRVARHLRQAGNCRAPYYCLSNTNVEVNSLPSPFVPLVFVVMVLPPLKITVRLVAS